ncbi:MAG: hypothetical protein WCV84_01060 [Patescibacteria group bacterium]
MLAYSMRPSDDWDPDADPDIPDVLETAEAEEEEEEDEPSVEVLAGAEEVEVVAVPEVVEEEDESGDDLKVLEKLAREQEGVGLEDFEAEEEAE